jgi:hypothetical protein
MKMKKIVLSTLAALTLGSVVASATELKFYQDENGQVFTKPAEGRVALKSSTPVYAKASKLKFSGVTYIGATAEDYTSVDKSTTADMDIRRAYLQLKAYFLEDTKSYFRVTYDLHDDGGSRVARAKYAYLYLDNVLLNTGAEIGLAHRPWHDYEEHNSWMYRSISKVLTEDKYHGGDLSNSADFGLMTKTKTKYFDADIGIFNGEGYHSDQNNANGLSAEWRLTSHILGTKGKPTKTTYFDASFFGQYNVAHKEVDGINEDLIFMGLHTVYNQPSFLVAAQYINSLDTKDGSGVSGQAGSGFSLNGEYRLGDHKEYRVLARYDSWTKTLENSSDEEANTGIIVGTAWEQSKNVEWVANVTVTDNTDDQYDTTAYMVTAEVKF